MKNITIAVVGLGYVGLPLAVEFGKKYRTIGYDVSQEKIAAYSAYVDPMGEVSREDLKSAAMFEPTVDATKLCEADFIIVSVPTPHKEIVDINIEAISSKLVKGGLYVDVKSTMNKTQLESRGFKVWRL